MLQASYPADAIFPQSAKNDIKYAPCFNPEGKGHVRDNQIKVNQEHNKAKCSYNAKNKKVKHSYI